jgi:hypothetical protein
VNTLDDLTRQAVASPVAPPPPIERIHHRAAAHQRRRVVRRLTTSVCAAGLVIVLVAVLVNAGSDDNPRVSIGRPSPDRTKLVAPPLGKARATRLSDGSPVWIVHHRDDTVSVVSAISTHTPDGLQQLIGWCPSIPGFEDGMYGSVWDEYGHRIGGPAPTDLASAQAQPSPSGHLVVGTLQPGARANPRSSGIRQTQTCFSNQTTGFDRGTSRLPKYSTADATTIENVTHQVDAHRSSGIEYVPNAALVVAPDDTVRLCPARTSEKQTVCRTGPLVTGVDAASLRELRPAAYQIIEGDLLLRPQDGTVQDITFTHGYTITTFSPSS